MNNIVVNFGIIFLIIILIFYMLYIIYNCKKNDNKLYIKKLNEKKNRNVENYRDVKLVEHGENFTEKKHTEHFIDYNTSKFSTRQNECLNNWITRKEGMIKYLNSLDDDSKNIVIGAIINVECKN